MDKIIKRIMGLSLAIAIVICYFTDKIYLKNITLLLLAIISIVCTVIKLKEKRAMKTRYKNSDIIYLGIFICFAIYLIFIMIF